jgi:anaerobic selenocysteine-containing dehydrogenase
VVKGLADRLGMGDAFPWRNARELLDYRLAPLGTTWEEARSKPALPGKTPAFGTFLTPSGKVELASSVLAALGYDPLPYYEEPSDPGACDERPFVIFAGTREPANYNTNYHQIGFLREREPEPTLYINPDDATSYGVTEGKWVRIATGHGAIELKAHIDPRQKQGALRVPHGWWKPETEPGLAAGLSCAALYNDGMLFSDEAWNLDPEQGLTNLRGGIHASVEVI